MTYQLLSIDVSDEASTADQIVGRGPEGEFTIVYDGAGQPSHYTRLGVNGEPAAEPFIYNANLNLLPVPLEVESIDDGRAIAAAYAECQRNPPQHPDFPL